MVEEPTPPGIRQRQAQAPKPPASSPSPQPAPSASPPSSSESTPPPSTPTATNPHSSTNAPRAPSQQSAAPPAPASSTVSLPVSVLHRIIPPAYRKRVAVATFLLSVALFIRVGLGIRLPLVWLIQGIHYVRKGDHGGMEFACYISPFPIWMGIFALGQFMLRRPPRT